MSINIGPIEAFIVHFAAFETNPAAPNVRAPLGEVCRGEGKRAGLHTATRDWAKVTCPECIEWRHA